MYTRVESRFWQDEKMRTVSDDARYLMLYLLTSPHRNILGFYFLPSPYACFDLGWDEKRFNKGLQELISKGLIKYDAHAHVVLVKNYLKHNPLENPNQVKSAIEKLDEIPETQLFQDFWEIVNKLGKPFYKPLTERLRERIRQRLGEPGTETETVTETGTGNIDTCAPDGARAYTAPSPGESVEAEEVTATPEDKPSKSGPRSPFKSKRQERLFDEFWAQYPKKRSKGQAERAWVKINPDEQLFKAILDGLELAKKSEEWRKENGRYIPYPATWLNAKGWEDEYTIAAEVNSNAQHRGCTPKPSAFGNAVQAKNRFAGLARDGGTGRIAGQEDSPNAGGDSQASGNPKESAGDNESHKVAAGVSMA